MRYEIGVYDRVHEEIVDAVVHVVVHVVVAPGDTVLENSVMFCRLLQGKGSRCVRCASKHINNS